MDSEDPPEIFDATDVRRIDEPHSWCSYSQTITVKTSCRRCSLQLQHSGRERGCPILGGPGYQPLVDEMHSRWTRFIKTGDAGWPGYDLETRPTMRYDTNFGMVADPLAERRQLWKQIGGKEGN